MNESPAKKIKSFTDLVAWKEGHKLVLQIYKATQSFPKEEIFGLTSQPRRAGVSITSNIAEGFGRRSFADKIRIYSIVLGSLAEVQNQLLIARDVSILPIEKFNEIAQQSVRVNKLINGLIKTSPSYPILDT